MYIAFDRLAGASHVSDKDRTDVVNEEQGGDSVVELSGDRHVPASGGSYDSSVPAEPATELFMYTGPPHKLTQPLAGDLTPFRG